MLFFAYEIFKGVTGHADCLEKDVGVDKVNNMVVFSSEHREIKRYDRLLSGGEKDPDLV